MEYKEILKISKKVFTDFEIVESPFQKYEIVRNRIVLKRFNERLGKYFKCGEIINLVLGTTFVDNVWVINYLIGDRTYDFELDNNSMEVMMNMTLEWYMEYVEIERLRKNQHMKYTNMKSNLELELREYKLNKII